MTEIDWSKAPEGATHWDSRGNCCSAGFMKPGVRRGEWEYFGMDGHWILYGPVDAALEAAMVKRPADKTWTGEGLPPIGAVIEIRQLGWRMRDSAHNFLSKPVRVAAAFETESGISMIAVDGGAGLGCEVFRAEMAFPCHMPDQLCRPSENHNAAAWDGADLPPPGIDILVKHESYGWIGARVVGADGEAAVVRTNDGYAGVFPHEFRPIRTPEQIAAEEREKAYRGMVDDLAAVIGISSIDSRECDVLHALADAGYRKTEGCTP